MKYLSIFFFLMVLIGCKKEEVPEEDIRTTNNRSVHHNLYYEEGVLVREDILENNLVVRSKTWERNADTVILKDSAGSGLYVSALILNSEGNAIYDFSLGGDPDSNVTKLLANHKISEILRLEYEYKNGYLFKYRAFSHFDTLGKVNNSRVYEERWNIQNGNKVNLYKAHPNAQPCTYTYKYGELKVSHAGKGYFGKSNSNLADSKSEDCKGARVFNNFTYSYEMDGEGRVSKSTENAYSTFRGSTSKIVKVNTYSYFVK